MIHLPQHAAPMDLACAKQEQNKYGGTRHIHLQADEGVYRIETTNGRWAAILRGHDPDGSAQMDVLIPTEAWKRIFAAPAKQVRLFKNDGSVFYGPAPVVVTFEESQEDNGCKKEIVRLNRADATIETLVGDGKFPDIKQVLPKRPAMLAVRVDPNYLINALQMAKRFKGKDTETMDVTLLFWNDRDPFGIIARNDQDQFLDILIVPLAPKEQAAPTKPDVAELEEQLECELEEFEEEEVKIAEGEVEEVIGLWLDETSEGDGHRQSWMVSRDLVIATGAAVSFDTVRTVKSWPTDDHDYAYDHAKEFALELARKDGLCVIKTLSTGSRKCIYAPKTIIISEGIGVDYRRAEYRLHGNTLKITQAYGCADVLNNNGCDVDDEMNDDDIIEGVLESWTSEGYDGDPDENGLTVSIKTETPISDQTP